MPDPGPLASSLPDEYVAVRLYSSSSFPDNQEGRHFASAVIEALSRRTNVVLLGHPFDLDEHRDVQSDLTSNVISIDHLLRPENNLALQTAVVGRATAFVGTYGGFSYLAPFLGVPSLSFSIDRGTPTPGTTSWPSASSRDRSSATSLRSATATCRWSSSSLETSRSSRNHG